jgi:transposase InsO family protein
MKVRMIAALAAGALNLSELSRELGVSRKTLRKWRDRFEAEGIEGLEPRSRRPKTSPSQVSAEVEDAIVEVRKKLGEEGLDNGAKTIAWHLKQAGCVEVPSEATIWRVLVRRGFVVPEPRKRPKASYIRFEAAAPNERWQIDATKWRLRRGRQVEIISIIDDHSRLLVACAAVASATSEAAWEAFGAGVRWVGLPLRCLSDNGLAFSGKLRGIEVGFEINLRAAGVVPVTSAPYHPQTCGKVERFHQTLKKWLRARPRAASLEALQAQLDAFADHYNLQRPHQGIGRVTPWSRFCASHPAVNLGDPITGPEQRSTVVVDQAGLARARGWVIHLGVDYIGSAVEIVIDGSHAAVLLEGRLLRYAQLTGPSNYVASGRKRGGPRRRA